MKLYRSLKDIKRISSGSVVTIGIFDGVHVGHIHMLRELKKRAKALRKKSVVLTFHPHPFSIFYPKKTIPLLISLKHRINLLEKLGIDIVVLIKFSRNFSMIRPEGFVNNVLRKRLGVKEILVGKNFRFGWRGSGDIRLLERLSKKYGFRVRRMDLLKKDNRIISSTYIRSLILKGRIKNASRLLARPVSILGTVKKGSKRGRILGYPTANIDPHHEAIPPSGVYAVYVRLDKKRYKGILNIGLRPTFQPKRYALSAKRYSPEPTIEVHILNFRRDIYGKDIEIIFIKRLRSERRFRNKENLIKRIIIDEKEARKAFPS